MTKFLRLLSIATFGLGCAALSHVRVSVPDAALRGDAATLHCFFDLEGDILYSVKWYKGRQEFYRYTPREAPPIKAFPIPGLAQLRVEAVHSNATQVTLKEVSNSMSGKYSCEVSADAPSFQTALVTGQMDVVTPPKHRPSLHGLRPRYRVGDTLRVNCTSSHSLPAANLSWILNGHQVDKHLTRVFHMVKETSDDLETSISILEKTLTDHDFSSNRLKVRCTASILSVYWQTTEKSAEWDRPRTAEHQSKLRDFFNLNADEESVSVVKEKEATQVNKSTSLKLRLLQLLSLICWSTLLFQYSLVLS